jgi:hypothetical protein
MSKIAKKSETAKTNPSDTWMFMNRTASISRSVFKHVLGALALTFVLASPASAEFDIDVFTHDFVDSSGALMTQAGAHADQVTYLQFNTTTDVESRQIMDGQVRNIEVDLPAGFYGNPQAMPTCVMEDIVNRDGVCNPAAQVGVLKYEAFTGTFLDFPVYNLKSPDDQTAVLGVVALSIPAKIVISVRSGGDYGLTAKLSNLNQGLALLVTTLTLWGVPADPVHDAKRFGNGGIFDVGHPAGVAPKPFLSLPSRCEPLTTTLRAASWQNPSVWRTRSVTSPPLTGCDKLKFDASVKARPQVTAAGAPAGFDVRLTVPQDESVKGLSTPQLRKAVVALPAGTRVSPSSADGLGACSDADMKIGTASEPTCPDSSKVGTVSIDTPVLKDPIAGDIILGNQRPDQLLRLWFVVRGPGLLLKIPGKVDPDLVTGQLIATFDGTPQLPFTNLTTSFKGGPRAAVVNPKACGTYTTRATLTPWSGGAAVVAEDSFTIDKNCDQAGKFEPTLDAGVMNPVAGGSSPFVLNLSRPSGQQDFSSLDVTLPPGLLAHVGDVPLCPEAQAAVGACGAASQVGSVRTLAGAGPNPLSVPQPGKPPTAVFLAGPYKGAPFSLSIVVPAQAGPFNLGTVVVRAALFVDPNTAQVLVRSDPLPTILMGIPLDIQKLSVTMDRPEFMISPTNCDPLQITAAVGSTGGKSVGVSSKFQATECASLAYEPKLKMDLTGKGQTTDNKHPALVAHLTPNEGDANIKQAKVILPLSLALDPDNANGLCEPTDAAQDKCPAKSIVGKAKAVSVLHEPLQAPVYFVRGERRDPRTGRIIRTLPKLYIPLKGEGVTVNINASSEVPDDKHLVTTFDNLPDVPLKSFDLTIDGGAHGILVVSGTNICARNQIATAQFAGQNGKELEDDISMGTPCALSVKGSGHGASTVKLTVGGLGAGKVSVSGTGIHKTTRTIAGSTVATVQPRLTAAAKRTLQRGRNVTLRVTVAFTPKGAKKAQKVTKRITLHS